MWITQTFSLRDVVLKITLGRIWYYLITSGNLYESKHVHRSSLSFLKMNFVWKFLKQLNCWTLGTMLKSEKHEKSGKHVKLIRFIHWPDLVVFGDKKHEAIFYDSVTFHKNSHMTVYWIRLSVLNSKHYSCL